MTAFKQFLTSKTLTFNLFCHAESLYNVETKTVAVDFGQIDIYPQIDAALAGLEIGVLGE